MLSKTMTAAALTSSAGSVKAQTSASAITVSVIADYFGVDPILVLTGCLGGFSALSYQSNKTFGSAIVVLISSLGAAVTAGPFISHYVHTALAVPLVSIKLLVGWLLGLVAQKAIPALFGAIPALVLIAKKALARSLGVSYQEAEELSKPSVPPESKPVEPKDSP